MVCRITKFKNKLTKWQNGKIKNRDKEENIKIENKKWLKWKKMKKYENIEQRRVWK